MTQPSLLLIHGAANGAWVWERWRRHLRDQGWRANVIDLRGHGRSLPIDFNLVTMEDYLADVESVVRQITVAEGRVPVLAGWSMGGLLAMLFAAQHQDTPALLLFSPSPPAEVQGKLPPEEVRRTPSTPYGPELYGIYPDDPVASRPALFDLDEAEVAAVLANSAGALESGLARRQRKRGIKLPAGAVRCPTLIVYGERDQQFPPELNRRLAIYLAADTLEVPEMGHWGIVYHEDAVAQTAPRVAAWLAAHFAS